MMKSVGLVLLTATFAYSGAEGANACATVLQAKWLNYGGSSMPLSAFTACSSDPASQAALNAVNGVNSGCMGYNFLVGPLKCEVGMAPVLKCLAGKLGYLKADGSINNTKIFAQFKTDATSDPTCNLAQYNFAVNKCGTTINNYAFLAKVYCIITATDQYTG
ncbi:uncharacterized protein LOC108675365 [Hyalella azteca]|uniref:Uncharacterized protein LOC108675365 n=1 Tax=Hyalella azteca TaxID=294128 RepID=A0A8B7NYN6_HYAAZ|nr:uncharacterized protein LOC108675365 [Hyalella azteca]